MSKHRKWFLLLAIPPFIAGLLGVNVGAQDIEARIAIQPSSHSTATISGKILSGDAALKRRNLSFVLETQGVKSSGERISEIKLTRGGEQVGYRKFIEGEYAAEADFEAWAYKMALDPAVKPSSAAHISWAERDLAILMLDDLLPQFGKDGRAVSARIFLDIPASWRVESTEKRGNDGGYDVKDVGRAVFVIGRELRTIPLALDGFRLNLVTEGKWLFSDEEAGRMASEIFGEYRKMMGDLTAAEAQIILAKFPKPTNPGEWQAETRGRNITIVSSDMPFKTQSLQRLHEQMRHEIFHLWLPNSVNLTGNYDWFYEGFALYESLKTGVRLNRLRFEDLLDTLSRAHNIDAFQTRRISLIESSNLRWSGMDTQVYARGMLAAFLCDLALLKSSNSKTSIETVLRQIYQKHRSPAAQADANTSVFAIFNEYNDLRLIVNKYISGGDKIEWQAELLAAGIENSPGETRTNIRVREKLNGRQKALLDELGYNNWRKISGTSR